MRFKLCIFTSPKTGMAAPMGAGVTSPWSWLLSVTASVLGAGLKPGGSLGAIERLDTFSDTSLTSDI